MVYMSGSKRARNQASIVNRTNVCGGPKKAGIAPRVGWYLSSNVNLVRAPQSLPLYLSHSLCLWLIFIDAKSVNLALIHSINYFSDFFQNL